MKNKISLGVDPGTTGFITLITHRGTLYFPVPLIGKTVDLLKLDEIFMNIIGLKSPIEDIHCVIEDVHAIFGSAAQSTFNFGHIVGALETFLVAYKIPFTKVQPKKWQKEMWQGVPIQKKLSGTKKTMVNDTKLMSEIAAKRLFPNEDLRKTERSKISDHNKVDSLLIAEYCRRNF